MPMKTPITTKITTLTTTTTTKPTTTTTTALLPIFGPKQFFLNFTITNLNHSISLDNKDSTSYTINKYNIDKLLNLVFSNSNLKDNFMNCTVTAFRPTPDLPFTTTEAMCIFNVDLLAKVIDNQYIKDVFINGTSDGVILGNYTLDKTSINVAGYNPLLPTTQATTTTMTTTTTTVPSISPGDKGYDVGFTIYNDFVPSDPAMYQQKIKSIQEELNKLYQNSALGKKFKFCIVTGLRNGSIIPSCGCYFEDDPAVTANSVEKAFLDGIANGTYLGPNFMVKDISVQEISKTNELPFWAIILICLAVLLSLILFFLCICLLVFCRRRRKGSFDLTDSIYGTYFPHLDMRTLY
ncbi:mucin-16-like [Xenopus tropicalis]|uniref:Mucin-16-like n=1 Tax=Xenopus tropicalis TaxID=8364 RepID=A0A803JVJ0_XENTR|nr:mucin-16-like [Xenopus tropicalis]